MMQPVLVTTNNRGVYFGYLEDDSLSPDRLVLSNARVCVEWSMDMRGFLGLADIGPGADCKISRPTTRITLYGISTISECTAAAAARWEEAPWSS